MAKVKERPQEELYTEERGLDRLLRRVNPLNDVLFKYLFASKDNKENLLRLLNDTLGPERRIVDVERLDRESDPRGMGAVPLFWMSWPAREMAVSFMSRSSSWTRVISLSA